MKAKKAVVGLVMGDSAGIGPEIAAKMLAKRKNDFIPMIISNKRILDRAIERFAPSLISQVKKYEPGMNLEENSMYLFDIPAGPDIVEGKVTYDSGKHTIEAMKKAVQLYKDGAIDGILMAPLTKQAMHLYDPTLESEFMFYDREFGVKGTGCVVKKDAVMRNTVTEHMPFRDIAKSLTVESVVDCADELIKAMKRCGYDGRPIAVAALNPHAGEDGLFGDEESTILEPAIKIIEKQNPDTKVIGPWPADTVFLKAIKGEVGGVVFLYHDQGNIAMKTWSFGEASLMFTKVPCPITSVGHGSALDIAGKGIAEEHNFILALDLLLTLIENK